MDDKSLTPEEVAGQLQITKNTVYEMIKRGELPAYRIGRKLRIDPRDVQQFRQQGKSFEFTRTGQLSASMDPVPTRFSPIEKMADSSPAEIIICGHDIILDILAQHLERRLQPLRVFRYKVGSFSGLSALYQGQADMAATHLWDGDSGRYNLPYVRYLLPGIPVTIIHLAQRMEGFYVQAGNPKQIQDWTDLARPDVRICNRETGCGTRILLDEQLRQLQIDSQQIQGYEREESSHLAVASVVARGEADAALGIEKASLQVRGIDFIPLQKERYEMVVKNEMLDRPEFQAMMDILRSTQFRADIQGLGDYDLSETGRIMTGI